MLKERTNRLGNEILYNELAMVLNNPELKISSRNLDSGK